MLKKFKKINVINSLTQMNWTIFSIPTGHKTPLRGVGAFTNASLLRKSSLGESVKLKTRFAQTVCVLLPQSTATLGCVLTGRKDKPL
jgi:hypothetical protein